MVEAEGIRVKNHSVLVEFSRVYSTWSGVEGRELAGERTGSHAREKLLAFSRIYSEAESWLGRIIRRGAGKETRETREIREMASSSRLSGGCGWSLLP